MAFTLTFQGMCFIRTVEGGFDVFLHPGQVGTAHEHYATLTARINQLAVDFDDKAWWRPDHVGVDADGEQIGIWGIPHGWRLKVAGTTVANDPGAGSRVALKQHHPEATAKTLHQIGDLSLVSAVLLRGGKICSRRDRCLKVGKKSDIKIATPIAFAIEWSVPQTDGRLMKIVRHGQPSERLLLPFKNDAAAAVTNVAMVNPSHGLKHFAHYYDFLEGLTSERLELESDRSCEKEIRIREQDVFDCIPPTTYP